MAGLSLMRIVKGFGDQVVLGGIDLDVREGEFLTIVGPSGCGKSTLLRVVAGLEEQQAGEVHIAGRRVDDLLPSERDVAMVFQSYALYPHLSVAQNIATPLRYREMNALQRLPLVGGLLPSSRRHARAIEQQVLDAARLLDIEPLLQRRPAQLSGGQRQRVALGRAIVRRPSLFLMDEPLSNLDAKLRTTMRAEIARLHRRLGITFVYVTHDQVEAMTMSDRVAVMFAGRMEQIDTPDRLYSRPATLAVASFIGTPRINCIEGEGQASTVRLHRSAAQLALARPVQGKVHVCFRPEAAALARRGLSMSGTVQFVEDLGADVHVHVALAGSDEPVIVRGERASLRALVIGSSTVVGVDPADLQLFDAHGQRMDNVVREADGVA